LRRLVRSAKPQDIQDPGLLLDLADAAMAERDPDLARHCVAQAQRLHPRPEELGRTAIIYQELKDFPAALAVLDGLVREEPRQARWRSDRGMVKMLLGLKEEAVGDWKQAIALDPRLLPAYLSLGSYYAASGDRQAALRLYAQALDQRPSTDAGSGSIRDQIQAERQRLSHP
jgi:tetratricopeptide (TPR) repeat protein